MKALSFLLALPLAVAAPAKTYSKNYVDTFDNIPVAVGVDQNNLVDCKAGGALCYNAFVVSATDPLVETAPSGTNVILTAAAAGQDTEGQPSFYIDSKHKYFTLSSICYAVTLNSEQSAVNVPETATIQFSGVTYGTNITVVQEAKYNPKALQVPFVFGCTQFAASFAFLTRVDVELIQSTGGSGSLLNTVMLDSVAYTAYYTS